MTNAASAGTGLGPTALVHGPGFADPADAGRHFAARLLVETDCSDVFVDLRNAVPGLVLIDTRSAEAYASGHVPGAVHLPHAEITSVTVAEVVPSGSVVVTYCWGPHCNAATKGAARLGALGVPVKEMLGGIDGWVHEGYPVVTGSDPGSMP